VTAGDRARQPRDPAQRGDGGLPRPALQPRGHRRRHRNGDPLLADPRLNHLAARLTDRHAELLVRPKRRAAGLALHRERRAEASTAGRAARAHFAAALRARRGQLVLELLEVALDEPTTQTERPPVAGRLPPLLPQPIGGLPGHLKRNSGLQAEPGFARREPRPRLAAADGEGGGSWGNHGFSHADATQSPSVFRRSSRSQSAAFPTPSLYSGAIVTIPRRWRSVKQSRSAR